ncbi:MAG: SAM-dependent methyltransferase [Clostridia bacterium]|nr:SAM-dependent methyltransferase [Clostridia bacterium]
MRKTKGVALRPRLNSVISMMHSSRVTADIGCDHGRLSVALCQMGISEKVIASDISEPSLQKAHLLVEKCSLSGRITLCVSDGLSHLSEADNIDTIIIAGMGGELIASLLDKGEAVAKKAERIILQPMGGIEELRIFIFENGYTIFDEQLVFDANRYYQIIGIKPSNGEESPVFEGFPKDYWGIGSKLFEKNDPLLGAFLDKRRNMLNKELYAAQKNGCEPQRLLWELDKVSTLLSLLPDK